MTRLLIITHILCLGAGIVIASFILWPKPIHDAQTIISASSPMTSVSNEQTTIKASSSSVEISTTFSANSADDFQIRTIVPRQQLQYKSHLSIGIAYINSAFLATSEYKYNRFGAQVFIGYDIRRKDIAWGLAVSFTILQW